MCIRDRQSTFHSGDDDYDIRVRDGFDRREEAMYTGHPAVAEQRRREAESAKDSSAFLGHRKIAGPGRADEHAPIPIRLLSPNDRGEAAQLRLQGCPASSRRSFE